MNVVQTNNNYKLALLDLSQLIELETPEGFNLESPAVNLDLVPLTPVSYTHLLLPENSTRASRQVTL